MYFLNPWGEIDFFSLCCHTHMHKQTYTCMIENKGLPCTYCLSQEHLGSAQGANWHLSSYLSLLHAWSLNQQPSSSHAKVPVDWATGLITKIHLVNSVNWLSTIWTIASQYMYIAWLDKNYFPQLNPSRRPASSNNRFFKRRSCAD